MTGTRLIIYSLAASWAVAVLLGLGVQAQSTDQSFPTPVSASEISGVIKARDIGDSRLTSYFYEFDGGQGDIFINVVTKNLSGDIDIYTADGLRPLTKVVVYADAGVTETGRLVYLRKPERLLLRIEGRSPGDDPASFRIKFGGSFIALTPPKSLKPPKTGKMSTDEETGVRVNSVGTIIANIPKPPPKKAAIDASKDTSKETDGTGVKTTIPEVGAETSRKRPAVIIDEFPTDTKKIETPKRTVSPNPVIRRPAKPKATASTVKKTPAASVAAEEPAPDPLASIRLVVELKDGSVIEHSLNVVLRFSVDKGILTVIMKDGSISRYSMLLVGKVTIQ